MHGHVLSHECFLASCCALHVFQSSLSAVRQVLFSLGWIVDKTTQRCEYHEFFPHCPKFHLHEGSCFSSWHGVEPPDDFSHPNLFFFHFLIHTKSRLWIYTKSCIERVCVTKLWLVGIWVGFEAPRSLANPIKGSERFLVLHVVPAFWFCPVCRMVVPVAWWKICGFRWWCWFFAECTEICSIPVSLGHWKLIQVDLWPLLILNPHIQLMVLIVDVKVNQHWYVWMTCWCFVFLFFFHLHQRLRMIKMEGWFISWSLYDKQPLKIRWSFSNYDF